jgi:anaerobic ribonucleoside-triphosphate reductase
MKIGEDGEIKNGSLLKYDLPDGKQKSVFKCTECYSKDPSLRNYQETEVYSRVVGYIRPVSQWNEGKQQEFSERKTFNV